MHNIYCWSVRTNNSKYFDNCQSTIKYIKFINYINIFIYTLINTKITYKYYYYLLQIVGFSFFVIYLIVFFSNYDTNNSLLALFFFFLNFYKYLFHKYSLIFLQKILFLSTISHIQLRANLTIFSEKCKISFFCILFIFL